MIHRSNEGAFPLTRGKIVEKPRTARLRQRYPIYWRAVYIVEERGHRTLPGFRHLNYTDTTPIHP